MDIRKYLVESERIYNYRIKTVVPVDDAEMDRIERAVIKYQPLNITQPKKTMFQRHPLDFPGVQNAEVYIVDLELGFPASAYVLQQELCAALNLPEAYVVVRGDNEPGEIETEHLNAGHEMDKEADKGDLKRASLLTISDYAEHATSDEELFGNKHTERFLNYLKTVEKDREETNIDAPNPLFKWMDMPKSETQTDDFNPKMGTDAGVPVTSIQGNMADDGKYYRRAYKDADGNIKVLSRKPDSTRKVK